MSLTADSSSIELRFGYTAGEISRLASVAVYRDVWHRSLPLDERLDIAWSAIAEHLYASEEKPESGELIRAAWNGLRSETEASWHTHGVSRSGSVFDGDQVMSAYARYWFATNTPGPEEAIVEHLAVRQIWAALSEKSQALIAMLAMTDDYGEAAAALGMDRRQSYVTQLSRARKEFRELWHEGEEPSRHWGIDRRRNPDAEYTRTHPGRSAAAEAIRYRRRRRKARQS